VGNEDETNMTKRKTAFSLRKSILLIFIVSLLISVCCSGYVIFSNWISSAKKTTARMAEDISEEIYNRVTNYIYLPDHINEINHMVIENGMLDLSDEDRRDRFFVEVLSAHSEEIYSFGYGTSNGEYYGARRNETGTIEIMRNDASTNGKYRYYSVSEDLTAEELVYQGEEFDPRNDAWYRAAVEAEGPTFAPLYKHFNVDGLAISAAWPVYDESGALKGVLSSHILLSDLEEYVKTSVNRYGGIAFILERGTGNFVANSMDLPNFEILEDGTLKPFSIESINQSDVIEVYEEYRADPKELQYFKGVKDNYYVNTKEVNLREIDWVVVSAIPESLIVSDVYESMRWAAFVALLSLLLSIIIYFLFTQRFLRPMKSLLQVSDEFSSGNLSKRVEIVRYDEIGLISERFNNVADRMQSHIENLEAMVQNRTKELQKVNLSLEESREDLRLILNSAAEGIYVTDLNGNCTFCNRSCIEMLGYNDESELLGKNMHDLIHHTRKDGTPLSASDCIIQRTFTNGKGTRSDNEIFWRSDGTYFDVEYYSYPQIKNGEIIGSVITFMDITERKQREAEIQYLYFYDPLTGLQNRRGFDENQAKVDLPENLPLSIIFTDLNELKLTNDIFGHLVGDELLKKSADVLKRHCRKDDIVARIGGDEFVMLLPKTDEKKAKAITAEIKASFENVRVSGIKLSVSIGLDTKNNMDQALDGIMASAENAMYKDKAMNHTAVNKGIIDTLIDELHAKSPREKMHSIFVREMCTDIGTALQLPQTEISKLSRAGYLHDIGKIVLDDDILLKDTLSEDEFEKMQQHSAVGFRILNLFDDTLDLAEYVFGHHERWDGSGYPRGLKGEQIPLISRIISVAETYERVLNRRSLPLSERKKAALKVIEDGAGSQFDPHIVDVVLQLMQ